MTEQSGLLLISHGSRAAQAGREFDDLVARVRAARPGLILEAGHLELAAPSVLTCLDRLAARGVRRLTVLPVMLFPAKHVREDIPALLARYQRRHPAMTIRYDEEIGRSPRMAEAARQGIEAAGGAAAERLILLVKGSSDPAVTARGRAVLDSLRARFDFAGTRLAFSGDKPPGLDETLADAARDGLTRLALCPYFLFSGKLLDRARETVAAFGRAHPAVSVTLSPALCSQDGVRDAILDQVA